MPKIGRPVISSSARLPKDCVARWHTQTSATPDFKKQKVELDFTKAAEYTTFQEISKCEEFIAGSFFV
jgi:hypothetical protein